MTKPAADPMSDTPATPTPELKAFRIACSCEREYHTEPHNYDHGIVHRDKNVIGRFPHFEDAEAYVLAVNSHATLLHQRDALVKALEGLLNAKFECEALCGGAEHMAATARARATLASIKE